jgi:hypothetical protein
MFVYEVLNPAIRMSWIHKHWDEEWVVDAEAKIQETVSKFFRLLVMSMLKCFTR